jgi:fatty acid/phospholipid biosynthesis enzyme
LRRDRGNFDPDTGNKILKTNEEDAFLSAGRTGVTMK